MDYKQAWKDLKEDLETTLQAMERLLQRRLNDPNDTHDFIKLVAEIEMSKDLLCWMNEWEKLHEKDGRGTADLS